ncbi:uncharacterized protein A4U43_C07F27200 [Asparagus officinalis]|uniref:Uncharacterized protein n=1 Tax=Asparagus officinalis TaxID=4686 RepID=A0A5P1EFC3_ASPOF|nr:uncharacterized protein A4U43_C07F27200 [Asparagus officinalis]
MCSEVLRGLEKCLPCFGIKPIVKPLASLGRLYLYLCIDLFEVHLIDMYSQSGKEPISLDHEDLDNEEKVDYEAQTDAYFTKPNDVGFKSNIDDELRLDIVGKVAPISIPTDEFAPSANFDSACGTIELGLTTDIVASPTPMLIFVAWRRLAVHKSSKEDNNTSASLMLEGVTRIIVPSFLPQLEDDPDKIADEFVELKVVATNIKVAPMGVLMMTVLVMRPATTLLR